MQLELNNVKLELSSLRKSAGPRSPLRTTGTKSMKVRNLTRYQRTKSGLPSRQIGDENHRAQIVTFDNHP